MSWDLFTIWLHRDVMCRMAKAWVLPLEIIEELRPGNPVVIVSDLMDSEYAIFSDIISYEAPFRNYV